MDTDRFSRFKNTPPIMYDGKLTYGSWVKPSWLVTRPDQKNIKSLIVSPAQEGRVGALSQSIYGTPYLMWVLLAFNNVQNPMRWPKAGTMVEYPIPEIVLPEL